jgi:hypothetical protein
MSVKYCCDVCEAERSKDLLQNVFIGINTFQKKTIEHVCPSCRDFVLSAFDRALESRNPRLRGPVFRAPFDNSANIEEPF